MDNKGELGMKTDLAQLEVKIIRNIEELKLYKGDWNHLLEENHNDIPFLEFDWTKKWWDFFGEDHSLLVLFLYENSSIKGVFPLMTTKKCFWEEINFIGYPEASYMDFILTSQSRERCIEIVVKYLSKMRGNYIISLFGFSEDSLNYKSLNKCLRENVPYFYIRRFVSPFIIINRDFTGYFKEKSRHSSIKTIKRSEKKLVQVGKLTCKKLDSSRIGEIFELHEKQWKKKNDFSNFSEEKHGNFYKEIALDQNLSFKSWVHALMLEERIIAFIYGFKCNTNYILYRITYDNDFSVYGPGKILLKKVIKDCFENGVKVFDFGLGYARYKTEWADDNRSIREVVFSTNRLFSRIIYSKYFLRKRLIEILKKYKCYDHIKVNTFGKVKYFISGGYFKEFNEAIANVGHRNLKELIRNTLSRGLESIYSAKEYTMFEKILDKSVLQEDIGTIAPTKRKRGILREEIDGKSCSDSIYEANLDDLDFLCQIGNEGSSQIVRRFYKKQRCFVASHEGKIIQYAWVDTKEMGIPDIKYKEKMEAKKAFIYLYIKAENNRDIDISIQIINYINNLLYINNFNKSSICINSKNPTLNKCLMKAGFRPTQKIKSIKVLFVSKIKTI